MTIVMGHGGGTYIGKPGEPPDDLRRVSTDYGINSVFVSDDTIFRAVPPQGSGNFHREFSIRLIGTNGTIILDKELPRGEVIYPFYPAVGSKRFAVAVYRGKGGSQFFDIAPHFSLDRIMVYDLPSRRWVYTLYGWNQGIKSVSAIALSPDGSLLGLIDQNGILQIYRLPPESAGGKSVLQQ